MKNIKTHPHEKRRERCGVKKVVKKKGGKGKSRGDGEKGVRQGERKEDSGKNLLVDHEPGRRKDRMVWGKLG